MNNLIRTSTLAALFAAVSVITLQAQDRLPHDEARRLADLVGTAQTELKGTPATSTVDLKQPVAVRDGEYGLMVLPAQKLSADTVAKAGTDMVPVGQLWLHKLAPLVDGQAITGSKLNLVSVSGGGGSATVPCCNLAVRKTASGELELAMFGKGKEPIATAPLKAITSSQAAPLDLDVERESDCGRVTVKVAGKYAAVIRVTDPELY